MSAPRQLWELNAEICAALGIDPIVTRSVTIELSGSHYPMVTIERVLVDAEANALVEVMSHYDLVLREEHGTA